jgi:hypothetical protein
VLHRVEDGGFGEDGQAREVDPVQVHAAVLASELRRRRVSARSVMSALESVNRETYIMGDIREAPTSLLVLAALSLTNGLDYRQA